MQYETRRASVPVEERNIKRVTQTAPRNGTRATAVADVLVRWPSGQQQLFSKLRSDQLYTIKESRDIVPDRGWK
jgi:hypothetical protein